MMAQLSLCERGPVSARPPSQAPATASGWATACELETDAPVSGFAGGRARRIPAGSVGGERLAVSLCELHLAGPGLLAVAVHPDDVLTPAPKVKPGRNGNGQNRDGQYEEK
jgi:hypothetical protein